MGDKERGIWIGLLLGIMLTIALMAGSHDFLN